MIFHVFLCQSDREKCGDSSYLYMLYLQLTWQVTTRRVLGIQYQIISLCSLSDSYGSGPGNEQSLTMEAVEALGFFINGSVDRNR